MNSLLSGERRPGKPFPEMKKLQNRQPKAKRPQIAKIIIKKTKPKRKRASRRNVGGLYTGLLDDRLVHFYPPSRNHACQYGVKERYTRIVPVAGAGDMVNSCCILGNPWYTFADNYSIGYNDAGVEAFKNVPTWMANNGSTSTVMPADTAYSTVAFTDVFPGATGVTCLSGRVRVLGVEVDIEYTGQELYAGGELAIYHGGGQATSAITQYDGNTVNWTQTYVTKASFHQDTARVSTMRFGRRAKFVWRPYNMEFQPVDTCANLSMTVTSGAGATRFNDKATACLPDTKSCMAECITPFGFAMVLTLANPTASGAAMPLIIRLRTITHEHITLDQNAGYDQKSLITPLTHVTYADTVAADRVNNELSTAVALRKQPVTNTETPFSALANAVTSEARLVARTLLPQVGRTAVRTLGNQFLNLLT